MNVFALIACKRAPKVFVPRETLWTRTNRYHKEVSDSVEGTTKTAASQAGAPVVAHPKRDSVITGQALLMCPPDASLSESQ